MITLHSIGQDVPLVEIILDNDRPIDHLKWKDDTCHLYKRDDCQLTAEILWDAHSHTCEYNDNMNSKLFILWVKQNSNSLYSNEIPRAKWY